MEWLAADIAALAECRSVTLAEDTVSSALPPGFDFGRITSISLANILRFARENRCDAMFDNGRQRVVLLKRLEPDGARS